MRHVFKNKPTQRRIISVRKIKKLPKTISEEQFIHLSEACSNYRDRFLLRLLFETGLRIGQALALRHEEGVNSIWRWFYKPCCIGVIAGHADKTALYGINPNKQRMSKHTIIRVLF